MGTLSGLTKSAEHPAEEVWRVAAIGARGKGEWQLKVDTGARDSGVVGA